MISKKETISIGRRPINYISGGGHIVETQASLLEFLVNEQEKVVSRDYFYIEPIYDDHYIVGNAVMTIDRDQKTPEPEDDLTAKL